MDSQIPEDDVFSSGIALNPLTPSSRIHFPVNESTSYRSARHRPEGQKVLQSGLTPPIRRGSPLNPNQVTDSRRRTWQPDALHASQDSSIRHRRNTSLSLGGLARLESPKDSNIIPVGELETRVFSDEYDLSHEDPRILQDVQRALKLKARRESRLKRGVTTNPELPASPTSPASPRITPSKLSFPSSFSPSPSSSPPTNWKSNTSISSDVDFGPSTGVLDPRVQAHPIPCSSDNGATLDWTGDHSDEIDRRWMGIGKKKDKDNFPPLGLILEQQEQIYEAKLSKIRRTLSPQTSRKAKITSDQLGRRYNLVYESVEKKSPLNLASVTRWYRSQQMIARSALEKTEPFTWLKHLDKRATRTSRSPWCLSALMIEEYVRSEGGHNQHNTKDLAIPKAGAMSSRGSRSPSLLSSSHGHGLGSSISMTFPTDDHHSPEPFSEANQKSFDVSSTQSIESSLHSGSSNPGPLALSPAFNVNDTKNLQNRRIYQRPSSPGSSSDFSGKGVPDSREAPVKSSYLIPELSVRPPSSENIAGLDAKPIPLTLNTSLGSSSSSQPKLSLSPANQSPSSLRVSSKHRGTRIPFNNDSRFSGRSKRRRQDRETSLRYEYEAKAHLLNETIAHNNKIRQFLNRISASMKDFDSIQNISMHTHGIQKIDIPKDLLEAFGHDPSAVTGPTRRDRGWRAVEDINQRVHKQRAVFRAFIDSFPGHPDSAGCRLDEPVYGIVNTLEKLQAHKFAIFEEAENLSTRLESVQDMHADVKDNYNSTVSHVSIVYPELSHIIALEESYKDQYQQFWELGMDALTLLLDTVTPFWRTYGKPIGEDVRDFLIIPLYRNEFTGEAKRYTIKEFPKRTLHHWLGLIFFFLLSIVVNILQIRAAISSTLNYLLPLIPYDGVRWTALPFFWVGILIQWLASIFEFAVVFLQLGVITWWIGWSVNVLT